MIDHLVMQQHLEGRSCDELIRQYAQFVVCCRLVFKKFNFHKQHLIKNEFLQQSGSFPRLWDGMRMLLIQASVENGFSVHRQVMLQNLKERSFIAQWTIHNHLLDIGGLDALVVDKLLLLAASSGRQKFTDYLERQRAKSAKGVKRKALSDEITALEKRQKTVQSLSRGSERHDASHEIKCIPPVCEGER